MSVPAIRREKERSERFCNPTTAGGFQVHAPADVKDRFGLPLCARPFKPHLLYYTDAEPNCPKCLTLRPTTPLHGTPTDSLEELVRRGVDLTLSHHEGTWVLATTHGFAMDCTLSSCIEQVMAQLPEEKDLPPLTSAILAREKDRRGTHPYDFVNEVHE